MPNQGSDPAATILPLSTSPNIRRSARLRRHDGGDLFKKRRVLFPCYAVDAHLRSPRIVDPAVINRLPGLHRRRQEQVIHIAIEITYPALTSSTAS